MGDPQCHVLVVGLPAETLAALAAQLDTASYRLTSAPDYASALNSLAATPCQDIFVLAGMNSDERLVLLARGQQHSPALQWLAADTADAAARQAALRAGAYLALGACPSATELAFAIGHAFDRQRVLANDALIPSSPPQRLEAIQRIVLTISSLHDLNEILQYTCRAVVELFGIDHSGMVLFDADMVQGRVVAEYPALGTRELPIPLRGVALEERLIAVREPIVWNDAAQPSELGALHPIFAQFRIRSILIIPVLFRDRLLGSFSLDTIERRYSFSADEIALCVTLAAQLAAAVEHANLLAQATRRAEQLDNLRQTTLAITSQHRRRRLLETIVQHAVALLRAQSGGIYEYRPERGTLELVADMNRPEALVGHTLKLGEGMAGRLLLSGAPFMITEDYNNAPERASIYTAPRQFGAVIEVPLRWDEQVIGVLYVDDTHGRRFTLADAEMLQLLADHAAIALINLNLSAGEISKRKRLEQLAQASSVLMRSLGQLALDDLLVLIAEYASTILGAESGGVFLTRQPGVLVLEASYGHRAGGFAKGREFVISDEPECGVTAWIAKQGVLYKAHGDELRNHPARRGDPTHTPSDCYSLLAIPLYRHSNAHEELIGMLRVDNKRDRDGLSSPLLGFSQEDEWILRLFANTAVVAIEQARLLTELRAKSDYLDRLVASLPNGVIAIDRARRVTQFNQQAEQMLQYSSEEILGTLVDPLYEDAKEPFTIGEKLRASPDGRLAAHETVIRGKYGDRIPIRLAATWVYDAQGQRIGSVGYFEDLRAARETERRLDVLLRASTIVAQADNFTEGLAKLAEMLANLLQSSFCRIFLLDEDNHYLETAAVYPLPGIGPLEWTPGLGTRTPVDRWPMLDQFLAGEQPRVLRLRTPRSRAILEAWSSQLHLRYELQSLLVIPLRARDRVVGLLDLGELRHWELAPFSPDKQNLAVAIAEQTAVLIDRMRLYAESDRQRLQFAELDSAARQLRAEKDTARLYQTIAHLAVGLAGGTVSGLFLNHSHIEEVELVVTDGFPEDSVGRRQRHSEGLIGRVARTGTPEIAYNYSYWLDHDPLLEPYHFQSLIAVPLRHAGEVEAVLFIAHSSNAYQFSTATLEILDRFAMHASLVLRTARLITREQRAFGHLAILHQLSDAIQAAPDIDTLAHMALTAITAGYGLGFNRAALLLLDERGEQLVGRMGIGHLSASEADRDWVEHNRSGLEDFRRYREHLARHQIQLTPVGQRIHHLHIPLGNIANDILAQVIHLQKWRIAYPDELSALPAVFSAAIQPTTPLLAVPLVARGEVIGALTVDNKFTREPITHEQIDSLLAFANSVAIAIDTHSLLDETNAAHRKLQSFYEASSALVSSHNPIEVLSSIVEQACQASGACGVSMVLFDANEQVVGMYAAGNDQMVNMGTIVRPNGVSIKVLRTGEPAVIEDASMQRARVNPTMFTRGVAAGLCLPVVVKGQRIGVMWVHYDTPRIFPATEIAAIQLYVNQAALAYDTAQQLDALRKAHEAARVVAQVTTLEQPQTTLDSIVVGTQNVLGCDAVTLYEYSEERRMLRHPPIAIGLLDPQSVHSSDEQAAAAEHFVLEMLNLGIMLIVEDTLVDARFQQRRFTLAEQVRSCAVIPLRVGERRVGVMFVNYRQRHQFTAEEIRSIETFGYQAAVAIRNAQLYAQEQHRASMIEALYNASSVITSTLSLNEILTSIARQACELIDAPEHPPCFSLIGLLQGDQLVFTTAYPAPMLSALRERVGMAVDLRASNGKIGITGRAARTGVSQRINDVRFAGDDYIEYAPETRSELAVPMRIRNKIVGVVNVENPQIGLFDAEHQQALELLAAQAAIAIENAQQFERTRALNQIMLAAGSSLQLDTVLGDTTTSIAREFGYDSVGINLVNEGSGTLKGATYYAGRPRPITHSLDAGITGRVARTGEAALVGDIQQDPDYIREQDDTRSELCVPLLLGQRVIGVINVESPQLNTFTNYDLHQMETIAQHVVNRIENARLYTELEQTRNTLTARTAVAWMGMVSAHWRHAIEGHAATICMELNTIHNELAQAQRSGTHTEERFSARLEKIRRMAELIMQHPITPAPNTKEDEAVSLQVSDVLSERVAQLRAEDDNQGIDFVFDNRLNAATTVRISQVWLTILFNIVVDNAIKAVRPVASKRITTTLEQQHGWIEIIISDTGKGMPKRVQHRLFEYKIEKRQGDRGMGVGLLLAHMIAQTYDGDIMLRTSTAQGTTIAIRLPVERIHRGKAA